MLERLDKIPWGELHAAYGPAEWVPEAIQDLLDPDPLERESARFRIADGIHHQQTADEATRHVVPFLIELTADSATPDRSRLLAFVAALVGSDSPDPVADQQADDRRIEKKIREYEAMPDSPTSFYQARWRDCQTAAWGEANVLFRLLEDCEAEVRVNAGLLLAVLVKDGAAVLPAEAPGLVAARLREAIADEADPVVRVGQVLALGTAASRFREARGWLRTIEEHAAPHEPAGLAAALRLIDLGEPLDEPAARRFVDRAVRFDAVACRALPWWSGPGLLDGPMSFVPVENALRKRAARLAKEHPWLRAEVESRASAGPAFERANALRLVKGRRRGPGDAPGQGPPIEVEPGADVIVRLAAFEAQVDRDGPIDGAAVPVVLETLANPDAAVRLRAARVVGALRSNDLLRSEEEFVAAVRGERDPDVVVQLCESLGRQPIVYPSARLLAGLVQAWIDAPEGPADPRLRRVLWMCLDGLASPAMADWLIDLVDHPAAVAARDPDRVQAVAMYRRFGLPEYQLRPVLAGWLRSNPDPRVRRAAVMSPWPDPSSPDQLPPADAILEALADDPSGSVRAAAAEAMAPFLMDVEFDPALAGAIVRALASALEEDPAWRVRMHAARNLGLAAPTEQEAQGVRSRQVSRHAALGQSSPGNEIAVEVLVRAAVEDSRHEVRSVACDSLQNVAAAVPGLLDRLRSSSTSPEARVRVRAAEALRHIGKPAVAEAVPVMLDILLGEADLDARRGIAQALWWLILWQDVTPWIEPLGRALDDPDAIVRSTIVRSLLRSGPSVAPLAGKLVELVGAEEDLEAARLFETLAAIGPPAAEVLPALVERLGAASTSAAVQLFAAKAVWAIGRDGPHLAAVLDALDRLAGEATERNRLEVIGQLRAMAMALPAEHPDRVRVLALFDAAGDRLPEERRASVRRMRKKLGPGPG
ncbi:MAG: HEAT repeat domain-containing protein [Isosphaeraceae bacterium]